MEMGPERDAFLAEAGPRARAMIAISILGPRPDQIREMTSLEHLAYLGAGYQSMAMDAFRELGATASFVPAANADAVAEYAIALMLACVRELRPADAFVRDGRWGPEFGPPPVPELRGRRIGIVGLGGIGSRIARLASAFGPEVAYTKPNKGDAPYAYYPSLPELADASDVLVISAPGGPETRHMVNADVLAALGPTGYLINVARGSIVSNDDLIAALEAGTIRGAGLDVVDGEPGVPEALRRMDNVIFSPHRAGVTREAIRVQWKTAMENLAAHFAGEPLITPIPGFEGR